MATHQLAQQPNYSTVAVVASSEEVPLTAFCLELAHALTVAGYVTRLSSSVVRQQLGPGAFDNGQDYRLSLGFFPVFVKITRVYINLRRSR